MNSLLQRIALLAVLAAVAACSTLTGAKDAVSSLAGGSPNADTRMAAAPGVKYAATLRVAGYVDQRKVSNPRYLGELSSRVNGMSGHEVLMDEDVSVIATGAIKKRFDAEGFQVMEGGSAALFEVTGVVKELTLDVKARDSINIAIETTLKEVSTGKVLWSGLVTEKAERFAGVSGNSKDDVIAYLNSGLKVASGKTVEAISATLMALHPELFNLIPGTKAIKGVTVYVAPSLPGVTPVVPVPVVSVPAELPASTYRAHASEAKGLLVVNTTPSNAKVYLDGVYYGMSPLRLEMEPGIHAISVKLAGYSMVSEKVSVRRGDNTVLELNLER